MDIECWNCNNKTFSTSVKISQTFQQDIKNKSEQIKSSSCFKQFSITEKKKGVYLNLISNDEDIKALEEKINEIKTKLRIKESIIAKIKILKNELLKGENIEILRNKLEENSLKLKTLVDEKNEILTKLKDVINAKKDVNLELKDKNLDILVNKSAKLLLDNKIRSIKFKEQTIINEYIITSFVKLNENEIISCDTGGNFKVWDLISGNCKKTIKTSNDINFILKLSANKIAYLRNFSRNIEILCLSSEKVILTLTGHLNSVFSIIQLIEYQLVSRSDDLTIKIWHLFTGFCLITIDKNIIKNKVFILLIKISII